MKDTTKSIGTHAIDIVTASPVKLTPLSVEKSLHKKLGLGKKQIKTAIRDLIVKGELIYSYEYGATYLERSFNRPVRISTRVVLSPHDRRYDREPEDVVVYITPGVSFGDGRHPTTRLSVRGVDYAIKALRPDYGKGPSTVLDIGTGTGILLIAAVLLEIRKGLGIDIDPCAIDEATRNVSANELDSRIVIADRLLEDTDGKFDVIIANLRLPTLKKLYPKIVELSMAYGMVVLSGIRTHESDELLDHFSDRYFDTVWSATELDWTAMVLKRSNTA